jgi:hypothetical protein
VLAPVIGAPTFIEIDEDVWCLAERLSVEDWRKARDFSIRRDDKHSLSQFRLATLLLEDAQRYNLQEGACLMKALADARGERDERVSFKLVDGGKDNPPAA